MPNWYAVYTKPRQEAVAERHLRQQEFEIYLPKISLPRRRRGKWVDVIEPLFPRYLFIRLDIVNDNIAPIRSTPGISGLVRFGGQLAKAPVALIETLMQTADADAGVHLTGEEVFYAGMDVMVTEGPFAGLSGIFQATKGEDRVIILLDLLGRLNRTTVKRDFVVPA